MYGDVLIRPTPVVVAGHGGEHARLGAEARVTTCILFVMAFAGAFD